MAHMAITLPKLLRMAQMRMDFELRSKLTPRALGELWQVLGRFSGSPRIWAPFFEVTFPATKKELLINPCRPLHAAALTEVLQGCFQRLQGPPQSNETGPKVLRAWGSGPHATSWDSSKACF